MNPTKTARMFARYESRLLTAPEVANSLLYDLVSEPELDTAFLSSVESLPEEVRLEFLGLLQRIKEANFHWTPFLISPPNTSADSMEYSAKLRQVCATLGLSPIPK